MNAADVDRRVREVVDRIVSEFSPSKVLLFGSRARGDARPDSDVDLIVVWKDENPPRNRAASVRLALGRIGFPMDLAVVTPIEFARFSQQRATSFTRPSARASSFMQPDGPGSMVREYVEKAEEDLRAAEALRREGSLDALVCFHSQQAAALALLRPAVLPEGPA